MTPPFQNEADWKGAPSADGAGPFDDIGRVLGGIPRPRAARLNRRGKTTATILAIALLGALAGYVVTFEVALRAQRGQSAQQGRFPLDAVAIGFIVMISVAMLSVGARQKRLISEGELAIARVAQRWMTHRGPAIRYEFTTPVGEHFSRIASDGSRRLSVGVNLPVFYDPRKPKKQLASCESFYEVILPGEE